MPTALVKICVPSVNKDSRLAPTHRPAEAFQHCPLLPRQALCERDSEAVCRERTVRNSPHHPHIETGRIREEESRIRPIFVEKGSMGEGKERN